MKQKYLSLCAIAWALAWWFGGWLFEFRRILPAPENAFLILASVSAALSWAALTFLGMKFFAIGMVPAPLTAAFAVLAVLGRRFGRYFYRESGLVFTYNFFTASRFSGWLVFFALEILTILLCRKLRPAETNAEPAWFRDARIFTVIVTALITTSASGRFWTMEYGLSASWTSLAGLLPLFAVLGAFPFFRRPPLRRWSGLLFPALPFAVSLILVLWFLVTLFRPGDPSPLPVYIPVLNPLDLLEGLCVAFVVFWQIKENENSVDGEKKNVIGKTGLIVTSDILVFFWIAAILARSVHYYGGVPWSAVSVSDSFQFCLFVFWALYGILHIIAGHRKKRRIPWIAGTILISADIAKLVLMDMRDTSTVPRILSFFAAGLILLFIGWAAPLPPPVPEATGKKTQEENSQNRQNEAGGENP